MEKIKSFQDLIVRQKAGALFYDLVDGVSRFPRNRVAFVITDQLIRSVSSISANIAEATGTRSGKDFEYFLNIARRSTVESENWFIKMKNLKYTSEATFHRRYAVCSPR